VAQFSKTAWPGVGRASMTEKGEHVPKARALVVLLAAVAMALVAVSAAAAQQRALGTSIVDGSVLDAPPEDNEGIGDPAQGFATDPLHHGPTSGHLPPSQKDVDLISRLKVSNIIPEWVTDVATYRDTAYLGAWSTQCLSTVPAAQRKPGGFWSVDISDPRNPRELGFTPSPVGSYLTEGLHAFRLTTPTFTGDVLRLDDRASGACSGAEGLVKTNIKRSGELRRSE